jgi:hypothetical protein
LLILKATFRRRTMHLVYIDDSKDEVSCVYSALSIPVEQWRIAFEQIKCFRRELKRTDGIYVQKEFHATEFLAGKGNIADRIVTKWRRSQIFKETLELITHLSGISLINAISPKKEEERLFERLLNRVNTSMSKSNSYALIICDEGKEIEFTRLARRMGVHNHIPSKYGQWNETGTYTKNIPIERIIEDPVFKPSDRSYFIQLADFCAFSLLRRERPTVRIIKYELQHAFGILTPILNKAANSKDKEGIIRL